MARRFEEIPWVDLPHNMPPLFGTEFAATIYAKVGQIFRTRLYTGQEVVFLLGPKANEFILSDRNYVFSFARGWGEMFGLTETFGHGLMTVDEPSHTTYRRVIQQAFSNKYLGEYVFKMRRTIQSRLNNWDNNYIDIYAKFINLTFDVAMACFLGIEKETEIEHFRILYRSLFALDMEYKDKSERSKRLSVLKKQLQSQLHTVIQVARNKKPDNVIGLLCNAKDRRNEYLFSDEEIIGNINLIIVAGHDTTATMLTWLLYALSQHPPILGILQEESRDIEFDTISFETLRVLQKLDNLICETERLFPPIPNGIRIAIRNFQFAGYNIPEGTPVFYSPVVTHLIETLYENPRAFVPDRFASRIANSTVPYSLVGFGGGNRLCLGMNFAKLEIKLALLFLIGRYRFALDKEYKEMHLLSGTVSPKNGLKFLFLPKEDI